MTNEVRTTSVLIDGLKFPEGPRWRDGKLWFSDMHDLRVFTVDLSGAVEVVAEVPKQPSGLGFAPDGDLLIVSMLDRSLLRLRAGALTVVADLSALAPAQCNDMVVDSQGRAYVGNFGAEHAAGMGRFEPTVLVLVDLDGMCRVVADGLAFPNGAAITPDGGTLIVGETFGGQLTAFDIEPDGSLCGRRVWAKPAGILPDGCCLDAEGAIWVASPAGQGVVRVREGGEIVDRVEVEREAYACMLGGEDRRTLFVLTAATPDPEECRRALSGRIEIARVPVPGADLP